MDHISGPTINHSPGVFAQAPKASCCSPFFQRTHLNDQSMYKQNHEVLLTVDPCSVHAVHMDFSPVESLAQEGFHPEAVGTSPVGPTGGQLCHTGGMIST